MGRLLGGDRLWTAAGVEPDPGYLDDIAAAFDADMRAPDFAELSACSIGTGSPG